MSKWNLLWYLLYCCIMYFALVREWNGFIDQPSFQTGWVIFTFPVAFIVAIIFSFRQGTRAYIILIKDSIVWFNLATGKKSTKPEEVTTVIETSGSYLLYSDLREIVLPKKLIPEDLVQLLNKITIK